MNTKVLVATLMMVMLVLVGCAGAGAAPVASSAPITVTAAASQNSGIWVTGQGKVTVVPDTANLTLGVQAQSATVSDAQASAAQSMDAVIKAVKNLGVADNDIQTIRYSISPVYNYDGGKQTLVGYLVTNLVTVKVRNVSKTGAIVDAVAKAGGDLTRIDDISFSVNDPTPYFKQARQLAMADASTKATQLADLAGVTLGRATYINESGGYTPIPLPYLTAPVPSPGPVPPTSISPGQSEIDLTVQVVYSIQ